MNICALSGNVFRIHEVNEEICRFDVTAASREPGPRIDRAIIPCSMLNPSADVRKLLKDTSARSIHIEGSGRIKSNRRKNLGIANGATVALDRERTYFREGNQRV